MYQQPSFYNQSTQAQLGPSQQPPRQRRSFWQWFKAQKRGAQIGLGCGSLFSVLLLCMCSFMAFASVLPAPPRTANLASTSTIPSPTDTQSTVQQADRTPTITSKPTPTATPIPKPTPSPTATLAALPTQAPTQPPPTATQPPSGVNGNPWGYDFNPGNLIYNPPNTFCNYFNCIASFWNGHGYVEECQDAMYSLSGGIRGSCSHHGGDMRPLYSH